MANNTTFNQTGEEPVAFLVCLLIVLYLIGIFGNTLTIIVIRCCGEPTRFKTNYYLLVYHLAVCDLTFATVHALRQVTEILSVSTSHVPSILDILCKVMNTLLVFIGFCEIGIMTAIAFLRYRAIVHPFRIPLNQTNMNCILLTAHAIPLLLTTPYAVFMARIKDNTCLNTFVENKFPPIYRIYEYVILIPSSLVAMVTLAFLYFKMCQVLARHRQHMVETTDHNVVTADAKQARNAKSMITSAIVVTLFVVGYVPINVLQLVLARGGRVPPLCFYWAYVIYFLCTCTLNPLIYGFSDRNFRLAFKRTMVCKKLCK